VLQRVQAQRSNGCGLTRAQHAKNAAFLAQLVAFIIKNGLCRVAKRVGQVHVIPDDPLWRKHPPSTPPPVATFGAERKCRRLPLRLPPLTPGPRWPQQIGRCLSLILSPFEWTIAKRYMLPGRGEAFIAMVAGISLVAVMLGVAALVIVMSVMNGFRAELLDKIVGLNGHAIIQAYGGRLDDWQAILKRVEATPASPTPRR